jgi:hypothetical protein
MSDIRKKHRVIGIRYTLKKIREAGLISDGSVYPSDAVTELKKLILKQIRPSGTDVRVVTHQSAQ